MEIVTEKIRKTKEIDEEGDEVKEIKGIKKDKKEKANAGMNKEDKEIKNFKKRKRIDCWDKEAITTRLQQLKEELESKNEKKLTSSRIKRIKQRMHVLKAGLKGNIKVGGHLKKVKKKSNKRTKLKRQEKSKRNAEKKKDAINQKKRKISKNIICLRCRKRGHLMKDCRLNERGISPSPKEDVDNDNLENEKEIKKKVAPSVSGICFNCGSTDHILKNCKRLRNKDGLLPYALCFICQKAGHISAHCPQNENGVYPNGGGCRFCSSKYHLVAECPEKAKDKHETKKLKGKKVKKLNKIQNKLSKNNVNENEKTQKNELSHHDCKNEREDPDEYWLNQSKSFKNASSKTTKKKFFVKRKKY